MLSENGQRPVVTAAYLEDAYDTTAERAMTTTRAHLRKRYVYSWIDSPVGRLKLVASDDGLAAILWDNDRPSPAPLSAAEPDATHPIIVEAARQLDEYFRGRRRTFALRLDPTGTPFQRKVWNALLTIPFGETRSYRQIAEQIGQPTATRAVGAANGRNPISIVTPCHRVIGASGALTGFGGGLETKAYLLAHEGIGDRSLFSTAAKAPDITSARS
jgi:methylated-DNA-[protein]-cysteine S-methyltransferase